MKVDKIFNKVASFVSKNSPYILTGIGATSIAAGSIILVKKVKKVEKEKPFECHETRLESAREMADGETKKQCSKKIVKAYVRNASDYIKVYGVPVLLLSSGVLSMFSATMIQTKRLKVVSTAYASLAATLSSYRERVKGVLGDEKEQNLFLGKPEKSETKEGEEKIEDKPAGYNCDTFSRLFGDGNTPYWTKNTSLCVTHVTGAEGNLNAMLRDKGFITLNEVYNELGFQPSEEGMYLGWKYKHGDPVYGDTRIDLGFCGEKNKQKRDLLNASWNEEFWIDITPPHSLFGLVPKEKHRSLEDKTRINQKRRAMKE